MTKLLDGGAARLDGQTRAVGAALRAHELSWTDPVGRLLWLDGRLVRGIRPPHVSFFQGLYDRGILEDLAAKKLLIDTRVMAANTDEFPLIFEHRVLPVVSYASEWCASQLKAAALVVLELERELRRHDLTLIDINPWNVLFDGANSIYVDLGSIAPLRDAATWPSQQQFHEFFVNPLRLHSIGLSRIARRLLHDPWNGISDAELQRIQGLGNRIGEAGLLPTTARLIKRCTPQALHPALATIKRALQRRTAESAIRDSRDLQQLMKTIELEPAAAHRTAWAGYYDANFPPLTPDSTWTKKHHSILEVLSHCTPRTVLDLGANRGWYAQLAAKQGARVIACDSDETSLNELFADVRSTGLPIHVAFMDVRFPEPAQGPAYEMLADAATRFRSDLVLALALMHHLVFTTQLDFRHITRMMAMFTTEWLAIEFVGPNDPVVQRWSVPQWYTLDAFLTSLNDHFEVIRRLPSDAGGLDSANYDRTIVFCRKKNS